MNDSPAPPLSYRRPETGQPGRSSWSSPIGWPLNGSAAVAALPAMFAFSVPTGCFLLALLAILCWVIVGGLWGARLIGRLVAGPPTVSVAQRTRRWLTVPVLAIGTFVLVAAEVPVWVTFELSRPAMDRAAKAALANPALQLQPADIGWYGWAKPQVVGTSVYFRVPGAGFIDTEGFAYSPNGPPWGVDGKCRPLDGPWYLWHRKF